MMQRFAENRKQASRNTQLKIVSNVSFMIKYVHLSKNDFVDWLIVMNYFHVH